MKNKIVSIVMPVLNETWSLEKVTRILMAENENVIKEIILVVHPQKTLAKSWSVIEKMKSIYPDVIKVVAQNLPFIGGALRKGFEVVSGKFTLMMVCDLETDPYLVKEMVALIQEKQDIDIVTASRWTKGGNFSGYSWFKKIINFISQKIFGVLYFTKLTDMTYGFRIFKTSIVKTIKWTSLTHEIFFEALLKPLRLNYKIVEIPAKWTARQEGESQVRFHYFLKYFYIGFAVRFMPKKSLRLSLDL